jgi:uncharacterized DUF497 family protein
MKNMKFEWDEKKRLSNIKKHGLDFEDVHFVFEDKKSKTYPANIIYDEKRLITVGYFKKELCVVTVIHMDRKEKTRIISFRRASKKERGKYYGNS